MTEECYVRRDASDQDSCALSVLPVGLQPVSGRVSPGKMHGYWHHEREARAVMGSESIQIIF